mmetsp:Transcript_81337/g.263881  ORF Transcript_81337/g.263881 Transcript_81337/m.263881 type:complete len:241 (-) Transcript_81337:7-729(-)
MSRHLSMLERNSRSKRSISSSVNRNSTVPACLAHSMTEVWATSAVACSAIKCIPRSTAKDQVRRARRSRAARPYCTVDLSRWARPATGGGLRGTQPADAPRPCAASGNRRSCAAPAASANRATEDDDGAASSVSADAALPPPSAAHSASTAAAAGAKEGAAPKEPALPAELGVKRGVKWTAEAPAIPADSRTHAPPRARPHGRARPLVRVCARPRGGGAVPVRPCAFRRRKACPDPEASP